MKSFTYDSLHVITIHGLQFPPALPFEYVQAVSRPGMSEDTMQLLVTYKQLGPAIRWCEAKGYKRA